MEAMDSDATPVRGLSLPTARESHDGGGEGDEGDHAPPSFTLSPFSRTRRMMERRGPNDPDRFLLLSPTSGPSVFSRRRVVRALRCSVGVESFGPLDGLSEVSRSGPSVFGWRLVVQVPRCSGRR